MEELLPVLLAAVMGVAISLYARGGVRWLLGCVAIAVCGLAATILTGEFEESWLYLLQDVAEAAAGLALGLLFARWALPRLGLSRVFAPRLTEGRSPNAR
jgi:hypothetical protein